MSDKLKLKKESSDEINLKILGDILRRRWYIVPLLVLFTTLLGWLYLRYTQPEYVATGTIKIESQTSPLYQLGINMDYYGLNMNINNEMMVLQSTSIIQKTLGTMDYDVSYFEQGNILRAELYDTSPFVVEFDKHSEVLDYSLYTFKYLGGDKYELSYLRQGNEVENEYSFGQLVTVNGFRFRIYPVEQYKARMIIGQIYQWKLNGLKELVRRVKNGLKVEQSGHLLSIIRVTHRDKVPGFSADFINALFEVYKNEDIKHKGEAADQSLNFIISQLDTLKKKVTENEYRLKQFKQREKFIDIDQKASLDFERYLRLQDEKSTLAFKLLELESLEKTIENPEGNFELIVNQNFLEDESLKRLSEDFLELKTKEDELLLTYTDESPMVLEVRTRREELKKAIYSRVYKVKEQINLRMAFFDQRIEKIEVSLNRIPQTQMALLNIEREYKVNETIFSSLLEKKAEASIAKASIVSTFRILEVANRPEFSVFPDARKVYIFVILSGFFLAILFILVIGYLDDTINFKEEIETISETPIIGIVKRSEIGLSEEYPRMAVMENPKSVFSESIRSIRTNLDFILSDSPSRIIAISSTVSGEGKSFVVINLAGIISLMGKKIIILDLDLRRPKMHLSFYRSNDVGLSSYLAGQNTLDEVIQKTEYENIELITSGPIPPNPAELIHSKRMDELLEVLKKEYEFIIIDNPPVGLVSDGVGILRKADIAFYVIRAQYSKRAYAKIPDQLAREQKIDKMYIVMNLVAGGSSGDSYYGQYGSYKGSNYGYYSDETEPKKWWEFWK